MFNNTNFRTRKIAGVDDPIIVNVTTLASSHQVTIIGDEPLTQGALPVFIKATPEAEFEPLQEDGANYVMAIVAGGIRSFTIAIGSISQIKVDPTALGGAPVNGTNWKVKVVSGEA